MEKTTCSLGDGRPVLARGWCGKHYQRWLKYGEPLGGSPERITGYDDRTRFEMRVDRSAGPEACHPWQGPPDAGGYGNFRVGGKTRMAHVVAWEFTHGPVPSEKQLDHECHNACVRAGTCSPGVCTHRLCCNERHLVPRTCEEHLSGESNGRARLTASQVLEIRQLLAERTLPMPVIAQRYGVRLGTVEAIRSGRTWSTLRA